MLTKSKALIISLAKHPKRRNTMQWLVIALGGALGSMARFAAVGYMTPLLNFRFPIGTFMVNVLGSFLIGVAFVLLTKKFALAPEWRLFFMTGVLGGFTTFSAFSLETLQLLQGGHWLTAMGYALGSVVVCLLAVLLAVALTGKLV
jgi:CrcB protein